MSVSTVSKHTITRNIRATLLSGLLISCLLIALLGLMAIKEVYSLNAKIEEIVKASEVKTGLLYDMRIYARERNLRLMMTLLVDDVFIMDEEWMQFRQQGSLFLEAREKYKSLPLTKVEQELLEKQRQISINAVAAQYELYDYLESGDREAAIASVQQSLVFQNEVFEVLDELLHIQKVKNRVIVESALKSKNAAINTVIVLGVLIIVLISLGTVFIASRLTQQAQHIENEGLKFEALIEGSMDAVLVLEGLTIIDANKNAVKMFGVSSVKQLSEMGGRFLLRFGLDEKTRDVTTVKEAVESALVDVKKRFHWYFNVAEGQEISIDAEITAINLKGQRLVQMVIRDVTERENFQKALKEINESLEQKVKERTEELNELNSKIAEIARSAGMAEVASGVLHNVGNVLNSINVSSAVLKEQIRNCKSRNIEKMAKLLSEHKHDIAEFLSKDEKGQFVIPYLEKLANEVGVEQEMQIDELDNLTDNINHIKTIVSMQQSYAGSMGVMDNVLASSMFEDAIKINISNLKKDAIQLIRKFEYDPLLYIDKHKMIQVLVNFISNARYAVMNNEVENRIVETGIISRNGEVVFYVQDNGIGIEKEDMNRLFEFGFRKRVGGHGYGLHHSALMAKEMDGEISVASEGPGLGARFTITVPLKPLEEDR